MLDTAQNIADPGSSRWHKLAACMVAMMAIANLQYAWTLFAIPLARSFNASLAAVQWAFTFFVLTQTWLVPFIAYLMDRLGIRLVISIAGLLVGAGWVGAGMATSLSGLYVSYSLGGIGAGAVYGGCISLAMKWFPDRRGLCVGAVAGSFGFGTALTVLPISHMIETRGYASTFIIWGVIQGIVVVIASQFLEMPPLGWAPAGWEQIKARVQNRVQQSSRNYTPLEMMKTGPFYILYLMMTMAGFGGLMVTAQLKPIGTTYGFDKYVLFGSITALNMALLLDRIMNGFSRPFWGWISDHIGRYNTMALAFFLEGVTITAMIFLVHRPLCFVIMTGLTYLAWGEIYTLFPSAIADIYGSRYATTNYAIQYTSKGVASILAGPVSAMLMASSNSWLPVFWVAVACDMATAALALFWLKPIVIRLISLQTSAEKEMAHKLAATG